MTKELTEREIIAEEIKFKVKKMMENKSSYCSLCGFWRSHRNYKMEYCLNHQKEFDKLLKDELEEALKNVEE